VAEVALQHTGQLSAVVEDIAPAIVSMSPSTCRGAVVSAIDPSVAAAPSSPDPTVLSLTTEGYYGSTRVYLVYNTIKNDPSKPRSVRLANATAGDTIRIPLNITSVTFAPTASDVLRKRQVIHFPCPSLSIAMIDYVGLELRVEEETEDGNVTAYGLSASSLLFMSANPCVGVGFYFSGGACVSCPATAFCPGGLSCLSCLFLFPVLSFFASMFFFFPFFNPLTPFLAFRRFFCSGGRIWPRKGYWSPSEYTLPIQVCPSLPSSFFLLL
jgi:hypothetical protein